MAALDSAVNAYAADIAFIGLSTSSVVGGEVTGSGYARIAPTFTTSSGGAADADLVATLEFDGPSGTVVTHAIVQYDDASMRVFPLAASKTFNSDNRLDLVTAAVTIEHGA
jgi:hypothetical protein